MEKGREPCASAPCPIGVSVDQRGESTITI